MEALTAKLREMGVKVEEREEHIFIPKSENLLAVDVKTLVYPGFPTDLQQPFSVLLTQANGSSVITDTIYSARFKQIDELRRMNANGKSGRAIGHYFRDQHHFRAATVRASDLRAGAALVIAGLIADGETEIQEIQHIERGYSSLIRNFTASEQTSGKSRFLKKAKFD